MTSSGNRLLSPVQIDASDLKIVRAIEWGGILAYNTAIRELPIAPAEVEQRLDRMLQEGLIRGFRTSIFVPPFLGETWVWGCCLVQTRRPDEVAAAVCSRIPFVTEVIRNDSIPDGLGPNLSILFYGTNFDEIRKYLTETRGIDYVEVYQIDRYEFPLPQSFSSDEMRLLRTIVANPRAGLAELARLVKESVNWTQAKLERLVWDPGNPCGVVLVMPEIDWRACSNFSHVHFLLELSVSPESVVAEVRKLGFAPVFEGRLFRDRYLQFEADIWGFSELRARCSALAGIRGIRLVGLLLAAENRVVADWVDGLLSQPG